MGFAGCYFAYKLAEEGLVHFAVTAVKYEI